MLRKLTGFGSGEAVVKSSPEHACRVDLMPRAETRNGSNDVKPYLGHRLMLVTPGASHLTWGYRRAGAGWYEADRFWV